MLYSSVLFWNATGILADLYDMLGPGFATQAAMLRQQAAHVRTQITAELWNDTLGAFVAATELESDRISLWGNALAAVRVPPHPRPQGRTRGVEERTGLS